MDRENSYTPHVIQANLYRVVYQIIGLFCSAYDDIAKLKWLFFNQKNEQQKTMCHFNEIKQERVCTS